jgi:hypothetical protein
MVLAECPDRVDHYNSEHEKDGDPNIGPRYTEPGDMRYYREQ